jgi:hypothetical protein
MTMLPLCVSLVPFASYERLGSSFLRLPVCRRRPSSFEIQILQKRVLMEPEVLLDNITLPKSKGKSISLT